MGKVGDLPESSGSSKEDSALNEFGKKAYLDSVETIKNFISLMVPLTTGLITAYLLFSHFLAWKK
jgi:hypothetical protein